MFIFIGLSVRIFREAFERFREKEKPNLKASCSVKNRCPCHLLFSSYKAKTMILRTVTLQEANGLLPLVRERFIKIHMLLNDLHQGLDPKVESYRTAFDRKSELMQLIKTYDSKKKVQIKRKIEQQHKLIEKEIHQIWRLGAVVRALFPPHIDFPSMENGSLVFLCWHGGDDEILHWHYPDENLGIRQSILPDRIGPDRVH